MLERQPHPTMCPILVSLWQCGLCQQLCILAFYNQLIHGIKIMASIGGGEEVVLVKRRGCHSGYRPCLLLQLDVSAQLKSNESHG